MDDAGCVASILGTPTCCLHLPAQRSQRTGGGAAALAGFVGAKHVGREPVTAASGVTLRSSATARAPEAASTSDCHQDSA